MRREITIRTGSRTRVGGVPVAPKTRNLVRLLLFEVRAAGLGRCRSPEAARLACEGETLKSAG